MRHRLSRAAIWRTGWLLAVATLVIGAQQLGWSRVGHALAVIAGPVGLAVKVGWPALLAVVISLLLGIGSRERLAGVAAGGRQGIAGHRWLAIVGMAAGVLGLMWVVLVAAPQWFVHDWSLEGLKAQNEVRTTLLQGLGGVVLLVGAYYTYRQAVDSRERLITLQQGRITERFTRAIDQLGHAQLDVRLSGIFTLEGIARDSPDDCATIGTVLTTFVRSHAPWPPHLPGQYVATAPINEVPELLVRAPDVQASLTVLARGRFARPEGWGDPLNLRAVDLRRAQLRGAHLERVDLRFALLEQADLRDAYLGGALLEGADLRGAHLGGALLEGADLRGAHLGGALLEGAGLRGAHLKQANLGGARLEGAVADKRTSWPAGFDWRAAGVIVAG
jgi:Pentapeptide repeats (8 copies)